jgi:pyruvyltransferase
VFNPPVIKKYLLGIVIHYVDDRHEDLSKYPIFKNPLVNVIKPYGTVEEVAEQILQCQFVVSSSLHGIIVADSYKIPNALFIMGSSQVYLHDNQASFKFKDYYSVWDEKFYITETLYMTESTTIEECITKCIHRSSKPNFDGVLDNLEKSIKLLHTH